MAEFLSDSERSEIEEEVARESGCGVFTQQTAETEKPSETAGSSLLPEVEVPSAWDVIKKVIWGALMFLLVRLIQDGGRYLVHKKLQNYVEKRTAPQQRPIQTNVEVRKDNVVQEPIDFTPDIEPTSEPEDFTPDPAPPPPSHALDPHLLTRMGIRL